MTVGHALNDKQGKTYNDDFDSDEGNNDEFHAIARRLRVEIGANVK